MKNICVNTAVRFGLDVKIISIESTSLKSLPGIEIVGLPGNTIKEAKKRIKAACKNSGITWSPQKILINLAPGDIKKQGSYFDLPLFVSLYSLISGITNNNLGEITNPLYFGEIGLDGSIKKVKGLLPMILGAKKLGWKNFVIPFGNKDELALIEGVSLYGVSHINDIVQASKQSKQLKKLLFKNHISKKKQIYDTIQGHAFAKRALKIAAAGQHNILLIGAPGTGKTLLAKYLKDMLPDLNKQQCLDVWKIHSIIGKETFTRERPFVHITNGITKTTILGGGNKLLPGLVSQAHRGVLFLDEICEFSGDIIDSLREVMQDKKVSIKRSYGTAEYPANCLIIGAMNPCRCGFYNTKEGLCSCSNLSVRKYQGRISGPIRDRFDIIIEIKKQPIEQTILTKKKRMCSKEIVSCRKIQTKRNGGLLNGSTGISSIIKNKLLTKKAEKFLIVASKKQNLSTRVSHKVIMLARTIADIDRSRLIELHHISEAVQYRSVGLFIDL